MTIQHDVTEDPPPSTRRTARWGRPPRELAGEVEERIVDAAAKVFLNRGLGGATIDEIAEQARAGKPSIYSRFPNKEAIFRAVVARMVHKNKHPVSVDTTGSNPVERLKAVASCLLQRTLEPENLALMRSTVAEAHRFPELGSGVYQMVCERGDEKIAALLREFAKSAGEAPAFGPERLPKTVRQFSLLVIAPLAMRALFGEDPAALRAEITAHVGHAVDFFLAAVRGEQ